MSFCNHPYLILCSTCSLMLSIFIYQFKCVLCVQMYTTYVTGVLNTYIWLLVVLLFYIAWMGPGPHLNIKTIFPGMETIIIKIRWSWECLIFIMGIPILIRLHLYIETGPDGKNEFENLSYLFAQFCGFQSNLVLLLILKMLCYR